MDRTPKILIVDDEPFNVDYLEQELEDLNYDIVTARNGREALDRVRTELPDLILLDIMMPVMDGFAVLAQLKSDPVLRNIAVIIISAMNDLESVIKGIKQGAEDYLPKPFEPTLLHARISASLEKKSLRDQQRRLFHTFATEEIAEELLKSGFSLGGRSMDATIMFADIRSFTTYTEQHEAAEVVELLNSYFACMFGPISSHGGIVNQIIGDGLMALFGTIQRNGNHRLQAVLTAVEMVNVLKDFNKSRALEGKVPINIGVGIASGVVIAGYAGTQHRATYTCVGDTVNLAARIESHTKVAGCPILIDGETRASLPESIQVDALGEILFKGKTVPVQVYSVKTT
ncbi:MAG TPA: adenylate/guanylate cyclase domain-containing protein [Anaerolineales bacterium]|nr:adenylate/guanylate cyclase domain-containing protein [Anaerolineales bacterium]